MFTATAVAYDRDAKHLATVSATRETKESACAAARSLLRGEMRDRPYTAMQHATTTIYCSNQPNA